MSDIPPRNLPLEVACAVDECLVELQSQGFSERIHKHDATLWPGDANEMRQRLGWLHVYETMMPHRDTLSSFVEQVRLQGFKDAVLIGMGGSSLGAEVLNQVSGTTPGYPKLHVLDSTVPSAVKALTTSIDVKQTLFVVASKSGGTLEPNLLYEHFWHEAVTHTGSGAGAHFVAITDAGSSLETLARERGFRHVFLNPSDIGGRFSVLSLFGLIPSVLLGLDHVQLLKHADVMAKRCATIRTVENPGAWLGSYIAGCARSGRDKLTILTSPRLQSFGLWAEQLIAESTGKQGKGIVPVAAEPLLPPDAYSSDRAFVYIRMRGDQCADIDEHAAALTQSGHPCTLLEIANVYDLGSEFYRWEYATAATGALLGVNPFDQPDVQSAKDASTQMLQHYEKHREFPPIEGLLIPEQLLNTAAPPDYVGIMAYLQQTPELDEVFHSFRRRVSENLGGIATTLGYGPRFLHSTGQLHKGGPNRCILLQIVSAHRNDVPVPGTNYSFGVVADGQALGDLHALKSLNRRVARIVLDDEDPALLAQALKDIA